jgi:hypothetical protein
VVVVVVDLLSRESDRLDTGGGWRSGIYSRTAFRKNSAGTPKITASDMARFIRSIYSSRGSPGVTKFSLKYTNTPGCNLAGCSAKRLGLSTPKIAVRLLAAAIVGAAPPVCTIPGTRSCSAGAASYSTTGSATFEYAPVRTPSLRSRRRSSSALPSS